MGVEVEEDGDDVFEVWDGVVLDEMGGDEGEEEGAEFWWTGAVVVPEEAGGEEGVEWGGYSVGEEEEDEVFCAGGGMKATNEEDARHTRWACWLAGWMKVKETTKKRNTLAASRPLCVHLFVLCGTKAHISTSRI